MTRIEFARKFLPNYPFEVRDEARLLLTQLIDDERKLAKIEGFRIAMKLHDSNPAAFPAIIKSLIEGEPP